MGYNHKRLFFLLKINALHYTLGLIFDSLTQGFMEKNRDESDKNRTESDRT